MESITVGIDVGKDRLDVAVRPGGEVFTVERNAAGLAQLCGKLKPLAPRIVALEATGGFETVAVAALAAAGLPVVVVNPAQIRAFAKAIGQRAKTDPIDADVIAHFVEATGIEPRPLPDEATRLLADLVARRRQIIDMIGAERQREKRATPRAKKSIARLIKALEKELTSVDTDIDDAVRGSPAWRDKEDLLSSVPGIGPTPALAARAAIVDCGGRTLMPGLIDGHVHVVLSEVSIPRLENVPLTLMTARAAQLMRGMLDRGFTTVRDTGGADWGLKEATDKWLLPGPRLFIAGKALGPTRQLRADGVRPLALRVRLLPQPPRQGV